MQMRTLCQACPCECMDRWQSTLERLPLNLHDTIFDDPPMIVRVEAFKSAGFADDSEVVSWIQRADQSVDRRSVVDVEDHRVSMVTCLGYRQLKEGNALVWDCIPFCIGLIDIAMSHKLPKMQEMAENRVIYHGERLVEPFVLHIGDHFDEAGIGELDVLCAVQEVRWLAANT